MEFSRLPSLISKGLLGEVARNQDAHVLSPLPRFISVGGTLEERTCLPLVVDLEPPFELGIAIRRLVLLESLEPLGQGSTAHGPEPFGDKIESKPDHIVCDDSRIAHRHTPEFCIREAIADGLADLLGGGLFGGTAVAEKGNLSFSCHSRQVVALLAVFFLDGPVGGIQKGGGLA